MQIIRIAASRWYAKCLEKNPIVTNSCTFGLLMGVGDVMCQTCFERRREKVGSLYDGPDTESRSFEAPDFALTGYHGIDWKRTARFTTIGALYFGPAVTIWYRYLDRIVSGVTIFRRRGVSKYDGVARMVIDQVKFYVKFDIK